MYKRLGPGPLRRLGPPHGLWRMPRSLASSSSVPASSGSSGSGSSSSSMDPEEQAATLARKQQQHRERSVLWFRGQAQKRLMQFYLEAQLRANDSHERSVAQQLSHFRRLANESTILEMEQYVCPQLEPTSSRNLREDLHALRCLLSGPVLPNDLDWIVAAGGEHHPPKRLLVQQLQRLVTPRLEATLRFPHTRDYAQDLMERCALGFYQDLVLTAWPLLDSSSQRSLQEWFLRYELGLRDEDHQPASRLALQQQQPDGNEEEMEPPAPGTSSSSWM